MSNVLPINDTIRDLHKLCKKEGINPDNMVALPKDLSFLIGKFLAPHPQVTAWYPDGFIIKSANYSLTHAGIVLNGTMIIDPMRVFENVSDKPIV